MPTSLFERHVEPHESPAETPKFTPDLAETLNPKLHARPASLNPKTTWQVAALFQALGRPLAAAERRAGSPQAFLRVFWANCGFRLVLLVELLYRSCLEQTHLCVVLSERGWEHVVSQFLLTSFPMTFYGLS